MTTWKNARTGATFDDDQADEKLVAALARSSKWQRLGEEAESSGEPDGGAEQAEGAEEPDGGTKEAESTVQPEGDDLSDWTVAQLREEAERRDLPVSGTKRELIERLTT